MPKANEVATELRKLADALDREPDQEVERPYLTFSHYNKSQKDSFLAVARLLPHPLTKTYPTDDNTYSSVTVSHNAPGLCVRDSIIRTAVCTVIKPAQPAEYDCELTLLDHEDAALTEA
jgi:hypothetical protein